MVTKNILNASVIVVNYNNSKYLVRCQIINKTNLQKF